MSWKPFTGSDRAYIVEHYHNTANDEIAKALGRTRESIASFAKREKLRKDVGFIAPKDPRARIFDRFAVIANGEVIFVGYRNRCADFIGVSVTSVCYSIKGGTPIKGIYTVREAHSDDQPTHRRPEEKKVMTDAMDWPLWYFKNGLAPAGAVKFGKAH